MDDRRKALRRLGIFFVAGDRVRLRSEEWSSTFGVVLDADANVVSVRWDGWAAASPVKPTDICLMAP